MILIDGFLVHLSANAQDFLEKLRDDVRLNDHEHLVIANLTETADPRMLYLDPAETRLVVDAINALARCGGTVPPPLAKLRDRLANVIELDKEGGN